MSAHVKAGWVPVCAGRRMQGRGEESFMAVNVLVAEQH